MKRLFLSIYLTIIATLVGFSCLVAVSWLVFSQTEDHASPHILFAGRIAEKMILNSKDDPAKSLNEWADISGFELGLADKNGALIAKTEGYRAMGGNFLERFRTAKLSEGRVLHIGKKRDGNIKHHFFKVLGILTGIALLIALITYPFVRRLTRRLENLTKGVALLGEQRGVQVEVEGCDECATLAHTFNTTSAKLDALLTAQQSLLANASHELRSPLTRLRMAIEGVSKETAKPIIDEIHMNIAELDALIEEILIASRLEANGLSKVKEAVDVIGLLNEETARLSLPPSIGEAYILGEARLLRRIFRNLLENAMKHATNVDISVQIVTPQLKAVIAENRNDLSAISQIFTRSRIFSSKIPRRHPTSEALMQIDKNIQIDFRDNGEGVQPSELTRIFEPFYRKAGHGEVKGGVGLGLSLARLIAREHGGDLVCLPSDSGAHFRMTLPL
jgi:two-component system, OmpR family, sensor kinase